MIAATPADSRASPQLLDGSDARLRALTEYALEIITVQDATGVFTYANEAAARHLGYPVAELLGRNVVDFLHPDDAPLTCERFRCVLAAKDGHPELNRFEYRFRHRDGGWCWLESVAVNALASPTVLGVIVHSRDINRRKADERILSLHHARYRTVADLSAGTVHEYFVNAQGQYELEWTLGAERVYGCSDEEYRRRGWQSFVVGDGWEAQSQARAQRYLRGETVEFTAQIRRPDGHVRWIDVKNRPIADPATGVLHAWWALRPTSPSASRPPMRCAKANSGTAPSPNSLPVSSTRRRSMNRARRR